jgi:hypothetical protein
MKIGFLNHTGEPNQINLLISLQGLFEKYGIEFTQTSPDLILSRPEALQTEEGRQWLNSGTPIIILERLDSSVLYAPTRQAITHKNVIAVFKNRVLRHSYLNNYPVAGEGRYHGKIINDYARKEEAGMPVLLDQKSLSKIKMVIWDLDSSFANPRYEPEKKIWNQYSDFLNGAGGRDIDVLYLGTNGGYVELVNWHRQKFVEEIKKLNGLRTVTDGRYAYADYVTLMRRTKIVVSPWGWGEWCWRDCEAIYFGCALVKPDSDHVFTYPDIFRDDNYYRCAADASDLAAAVAAAMENWPEEVEARYNLRRSMIEKMNIESLIGNLATAIHDAYAGR